MVGRRGRFILSAVKALDALRRCHRVFWLGAGKPDPIKIGRCQFPGSGQSLVFDSRPEIRTDEVGLSVDQERVGQMPKAVGYFLCRPEMAASRFFCLPSIYSLRMYSSTWSRV